MCVGDEDWSGVKKVGLKCTQRHKHSDACAPLRFERWEAENVRHSKAAVKHEADDVRHSKADVRREAGLRSQDRAPSDVVE